MRNVVDLIFSLLCFSICLVLASSKGFYKPGKNPPNIVMIVADDLGWGDVGFNDLFHQVRTPYIDALAAHGITLNNYYTAPMCTPSRSELLTGRYASRVGMQHYVVLGAGPYGLPLDQTLLPQKLKSLGYTTHMIGKWHLGHYREEYFPTSRGFDSFYGYMLGEAGYYGHRAFERGMWGLDLRNGTAVDKDQYGVYSTELFTDEAERKIREHGSMIRSKAKEHSEYMGCQRRQETENDETSCSKEEEGVSHRSPLFLMVNHQSPHTGNTFRSYEVPSRFLDRVSHVQNPERKNHAALVASLDDTVGRVVKALDQEELLENTLLVFTTDNGGAAAGYGFGHSSNWPLRGVKASTWEGGIKGVGFVWSPLFAKDKFGTTYDNLIHITDWLPTFIEGASGGNVGENVEDSEDGPLDGVSHWEDLINSSDSPAASPRREALLMLDDTPEDDGSPTMMSAIRVGDYKLMWGQREFGLWSDWYEPNDINHEGMKKMLPVPWLDQNEEFKRQFANYHPEDSYRITEMTKAFEEDTTYLNVFNERLDRLTKVTTNSKINSTHVDCGPTPSVEIISRCNPNVKPCLFNIARDPCEYVDLADSLPEIVEELKSKILAHAAKARKPVNRPLDPALDPKFNGDVWGAVIG